MAFEKKVPQWNAQGAEPPESLKNSGFQPEYKPPADYFNWFWYGMSEAVKELQEKAGSSADLKEHTANKSNPHGVTPADIGALALSGGVMTGQGFYLNNKTGRIVGNQNGMWFRTASSDVDNNNDSRHLKLWNATYQTELARALYLFDTQTGKDYTIFGEHCKRGGSYTGNGSSTSRTIDIGGIGYCLLVWSSKGFVLATPSGAVSYPANGTGNAMPFTNTEFGFSAGKLTMAAQHETVNSSGITYNYQVL